MNFKFYDSGLPPTATDGELCKNVPGYTAESCTRRGTVMTKD